MLLGLFSSSALGLCSMDLGLFGAVLGLFGAVLGLFSTGLGLFRGVLRLSRYLNNRLDMRLYNVGLSIAALDDVIWIVLSDQNLQD